MQRIIPKVVNTACPGPPYSLPVLHVASGPDYFNTAREDDSVLISLALSGNHGFGCDVKAVGMRSSAISLSGGSISTVEGPRSLSFSVMGAAMLSEGSYYSDTVSFTFAGSGVEMVRSPGVRGSVIALYNSAPISANKDASSKKAWALVDRYRPTSQKLGLVGKEFVTARTDVGGFYEVLGIHGDPLGVPFMRKMPTVYERRPATGEEVAAEKLRIMETAASVSNFLGLYKDEVFKSLAIAHKFLKP